MWRDTVMIETRDEERERLERHARAAWLERIEQALWRMHERHELYSWEEGHYYGGVSFVIAHRREHGGY